MKPIDLHRKAISRIKKNLSKNNKYKKVTSEEQELNIMAWTFYWRKNIHRFVEEFLEIRLHLFQQIILFFMNLHPIFVLIASRGLSKSFMTALFACARCILYPGEKVIIASGTKKQARLIINQKIQKELMILSPTLAHEIERIVDNNQESKVIFKNGSSIEAVTSSDGSRGYRATILILDEYRLIDWTVIRRVLKPFLIASRNPNFLKLAKYKNYPIEENKQIYLSSAWYKDSDMYKHFKSEVHKMLNGNRSFVVALNYQLSIDERLTTEAQIQDERENNDFSEVDFILEYETLFYGLSENAFFGYDDIIKNRTLEKPFYPLESRIILGDTFAFSKKIPKQKGEVRVMGYDVAVASGDKNDNSILSILRLMPKGQYYIKQLVYMKNIHGMLTSEQAKLIKRYFYDFECDYVALDCVGNGIGVYDQLTLPTYDEITGVEYPEWTAFNNKDLSERASKNALKVIYAVQATSQFNHEIANALRDDLSLGRLKLLLKDYEAQDYLSDKVDYDILSAEKQAELIEPFVQTTLLQSELLNLEWEVRSAYIRLFKRSGNRKDRYSSVAYANKLARHLEDERLKKKKQRNYEDFCLIN